MAVFDTVLVANRGEIAARIMRTLRRMGIESVAVYADADAGLPYVDLADRAYALPDGYLDIDGLIEIALASGSQAVHPGYGFLAENPRFARACIDAGIAFIGAPPEVLEAMGDKIAAKLTAIAAGVPVVPGRHDPGMDDAALAAAIAEVGFPALLKPSAGGGGKGMVVVREPSEIDEALGAPVALRGRRLPMTPCSSSAMSTGRATSRSRSLPTGTAMSSTSASVSARSNDATRRW